jgi:hypothetical protein
MAAKELKQAAKSCTYLYREGNLATALLPSHRERNSAHVVDHLKVYPYQ